VNTKKKRESTAVTKINDETGEKEARKTKRPSASISFEELTSQLGE
jgi:hypothetical protein